METRIFNKFFAEQCITLKNYRVLQINRMFLTHSRLGNLDFNENEILKIRALNIALNKAHGHDDISIRIVKIRKKPLLKPLVLLFQKRVDARVNNSHREKLQTRFSIQELVIK